MKTTILSSLALLWTSLIMGATANDCNLVGIIDACGDIHLESIDDSVYGVRTMAEYDTNVMSKALKYYNRLLGDHPGVEGRDNPDLSIASAFMHFICFEPIILSGEETKIYNCIREICPRFENMESSCLGMNS